MARVATHLSVSGLERHTRAAKEATAARHYQAIWLLAKGHTVPEVAEMTSFGTRWLEQLLSRTNARGPSALGDRRRHNGRAPTILKPAPLARLGGAPGDRLDHPGAAPTASASGDGGTAGGV